MRNMLLPRAATMKFLATTSTLLLVLGLLLSDNSVDALLAPSRAPRKASFRRSNDVVLCHSVMTSMTGGMEAAAGLVLVGGGAAWWLSGTEERAKRAQYADWEATDNAQREERARLAYIEPRETWTEAELLQFDGTTDDATGPLLFAASGTVFNVWKGRHFYGPGCEYHIFAGRDATRLLAKSKLEEETPEERSVPLSIAERATLEGWYWIFKNKYDVCGKLEGYDPKS
jgi:membrane-associated progesterone receptor component